MDDGPDRGRVGIGEDRPCDIGFGAATGVGLGDVEIAAPFGVLPVFEDGVDIGHAVCAEEETVGAELGRAFCGWRCGGLLV